MELHSLAIRCGGILLATLATTSAAGAQRTRGSGAPGGAPSVEVVRAPGEVSGQESVSFSFLPLSARDRFGSSVCRLGDLDGDGIGDLAVGTPRDNLPNLIGSFWIVFLDAQGKERAWKFVAPSRPIPPGQFSLVDQFGTALAPLGDLDGDGAMELAVGAPTLGTTPEQGTGKAWILSLESDGSIRAQHAIGEGESGFTEDLDYSDLFGGALAAIGDLDGDGVGDLAVGAQSDDVDFVRTGSLRILLLNADATVKSVTTIANGLGNFSGALEAGDQFGSAVTGLGDLDGDGVLDLAVGARGDLIPLVQDKRGSVWILFMNPDGTVRTHSKLDPVAATEGFGAALDSFDLEGDGVPELLVGAPLDHETTANTGATFLVSLDANGSPLGSHKLSHHSGGVTGIRSGDVFGSSVAAAGDIDGDGLQDLFVGSPLNSNTPCLEVGVLYRLQLSAAGTVADQYEMGGRCLGEERFGSSAAEIGDLTGDGTPEYAIGAPGPGSTNSIGSVWMFSPSADNRFAPLLQLYPDTTNVTPLSFGMSLAPLGDLNGDGRPDLAVGALERLYVFRLGANGTVLAQRTFVSGLTTQGFGASLCALDDLDGDGRPELASGAPLTRLDLAGTSRNRAGAVVIVSLNADGTRRSSFLIRELEGGFTGFTDSDERFGAAVAWLGDLDGDGYGELAVGAPASIDAAEGRAGTVWILSLAFDGAVVREIQLGYGLADFQGPLAVGDRFGSGLANAGDLDGDGLPELVVAAPGDDQDGAEVGALWVLFLRPDATVREARKLSKPLGVRGPLFGGAELGSGLSVLPAFGGPSSVGLFVGAPLDDRIATNAGVAWIVSLFRP